MSHHNKKIFIMNYPISFLMPSLIMIVVLFSKGIYWGSEKTLLASDGFHQYVVFAQNLRNIFHGSDSIFYTFTSGLGLNFYALSSYYLGSFLSPFYYFFEIKSMPDAIYLFTLIKFGLIGLSTFYSLHHIYSKVKTYFLLGLSTAFALMSFLSSQFEINTWLDVFILLPLIILGLHKLIESKPLLYYSTLTILFIQNYYFAYMVSIFLSLYLCIQLLKLETVKKKFQTFTRFVFNSVLAALSASFMLLPTFLDLKNQGESFTKITNLLTDNSWYLDLVAKNILGTYDTTKFDAIPMIYVGLFPLLLTFLYFTVKSIKWQIRFSYFLLLIFICVSYYLQPLDLFWQAMHAPNMFLHRYAWSIPLLLILLSCETLSHLEEIKLSSIVTSFVSLSLILASPFLFIEHYSFLNPGLFLLTISFLAAYTIILISLEEFHFPVLIITIFTLLFTTLETTLNTYYLVSGLEEEWVFPSRESYNRNLNSIDQLVNYQKQTDHTFYRTERLLPQTGNDGMKFNYNGISQFSSIRNRQSSRILDRLGFKSEGTNLNLRYQNNTLISDSIFAVKYNLSETYMNKYGFNKMKQVGDTVLYKNAYALPLAILTDGKYRDSKFTVNTLDNQTKLLNDLSGKNFLYFQEQGAQILSQAKLFTNQVKQQAIGSANDTVVTYRLNIPKESQMYLSLPNIIFENQDNKDVLVSINGKTSHFTTDNVFSFFDIGYFPKQQNVDIQLIFPNNKSIAFNNPHFYSLNTEKYKSAITEIQKRPVKVSHKNNQVSVSYQTDKPSSLFLTIPYDKGWQAKRNGKKVPIRKAQDGFLLLDVKKGRGKIELSFIPNGFKEGVIISVISLVLALIYFTFNFRQRKNNQ